MSDKFRRANMINDLRPWIERARTFTGWSFPDLHIKHLDPPPTWDYEAIVRDFGSRARSAVDLGTGGGEVLSRVVAGMGARFVATEEWSVNVPIARDRLAPHGIDVAWASAECLPFRDGAFDLVIDRHEALSPAEVARVLMPGGAVITQQCGPDNWRELRDFFPRAAIFDDHWTAYTEGFEAAGLRVVRREHHRFRSAFGSISEVAFLLMTAPWTVPDFDPLRDLESLISLEDALRTDDGIVLTETRYLILAEQPA